MTTKDHEAPYMPPEIHYFECICKSDEHLLKFQFDKDPKDPSLYTTIHLQQWRNPLKRVWTAIKYVFGFKSKYGQWDCWEIEPGDAIRLITLCQEYIELNGYGSIPGDTFSVEKELK